jgi:ATP/maltotriose-dependent transcriptional regulator MalT
MEAAFRWAHAASETDQALDLAAGLGAFHHLVGTVTLGRELIDEALALPGGDPARRLAAMRWQIGLLLCELRLDAAADAIAAARALCDRHGTPRDADELASFAAHLALCVGDLARAEREGDGVLERALARGDRYTAAYAAWTQGALGHVRGDADEALAHFGAACEHLIALVDVCAFDNCAAALAEAAAAAGRHGEASDMCERALAFAPERPLGERNTFLLHEAALAAVRRGEADRAAELAGAALTGARRDPVSIGPWHAPVARGDVALAAGDRDAARAEYDQALAFALHVREQVGASLPVEARLALTHLRLAGIASSAETAGDHLARAADHARASRAPALVEAVAAATVGAR